MQKPSSSAVKAGPATNAAAPMISAKIMSLKFMQRRQKPADARPPPPQQPADATQPQQPDAPAAAAGAATAVPVFATTPAELEAQWTIEINDFPLVHPQVVIAQLGMPQPANLREALLRFKQGRRSFGKFNPKLETRLAELRQEKDTAQREIKAEAEVKAAERTKLESAKRNIASVEPKEAAQMTSYYSKYIHSGNSASSAPPVASLVAPPEVSAPVGIREKPIGIAKPKGKGGKMKKKRVVIASKK